MSKKIKNYCLNQRTNRTQYQYYSLRLGPTSPYKNTENTKNTRSLKTRQFLGSLGFRVNMQ